MGKHDGRHEFDLIVAYGVVEVDEEIGSKPYSLGLEHGPIAYDMFKHAMRKSILPDRYRMRVLVTPRGYEGSYALNSWDEYKAELLFRFVTVESSMKEGL